MNLGVVYSTKVSEESISSPYSPNLNLIERLWRFVKKLVMYSTHYENFNAFKN
jgi:hypothetical protein